MDRQTKDYFRVATLFSLGILLVFLLLMAVPYLCDGGTYSPDKYRMGQTESINRYASSNLATALASIGVEDRTLVVDTAVTLSEDANVPDNITVNVIKGGSITLGNHDLILRSFDAGSYACFVYGGTGAVEFKDGAVECIREVWFPDAAKALASLPTSITTAVRLLTTTGSVVQYIGSDAAGDDYLFKDANGVTIGTIEGDTRDVEFSGSLTAVGLDSGDGNLMNVGESHLDSIHSDANTEIPISNKLNITGNITTSSYKDALTYGTTYTDTTLAAAIADISTNHWTLNISRGTWAIDANLIFAANTRLKFEEGAVFDIDGADVVINSDPDAGLYQIFDVDANSSLALNGVDEIPIQWTGAVDDYSSPTGTDNYDAIQDAINACPDYGTVVVRGQLGFATESEITIPRKIDFIQDVPIYYTGSSNESCLEIGTSGSPNVGVTLKLNVEKAVQSTWADANHSCIGIKLFNPHTSTIHIERAANFTVGAQFLAENSQCACYNTVHLNYLKNNKYNLNITQITSGSPNENLFLGGRFGTDSEINTALARYGVIFDSQDNSYQSHNNNVFIKPSFEMNNDGAGVAYAIKFDDCGGDNRFLDIREEANDYVAHFTGASYNNLIECGYSNIFGILDEATYGTNIVYKANHGPHQIASRMLFDCSNLYDIFYSYNATNNSIYGISIARTGDATIHNSAILTHLYKDANSECVVVTASAGVGMKVDTHTIKQFMITPIADSTSIGGRCYVRCYDTNGNQLTDPNQTNLYVRGTTFQNPTWVSFFGGGYRTGADSDQGFFFRVTDDVKSIWVGIVGGTASAQLKGFRIYTPSYEGNARIYPGIDHITYKYGYGSDTAADDDYLVDLYPPLSAYIVGTSVYFDANNKNVGACTLNINSIGADSLKMLHNQDPPNDYIEDGSIIHVIHDGTNWQIQTPDANP